MAEYIERENLVDEIKSLSVFLAGDNVFNKTAKDSVLRIIDEQATADVVEVKHGKLIIVEEEIGLYSCSICGYKMLRAKCNYCPDCGAKLDAKDGAE